ncbi:unnamed protein product [Agarophyton chilense]
MLAYDARAIPIPPLHRIHHAPTRHTITHLVRSSDVNLSLTNLIIIARTDPCLIPAIISAIRRYLLPTRTRRIQNASHPLQLLHKLVLCVPYFYRYIASPAFFKQFWRLNVDVDPSSSVPSASLLLAAWARDLRRMARRNDPAANFWYITARNISKQQRLPRVPHRTFVYPVATNILHRITAPLVFLNQDETKRTLRLMNQMNQPNSRWRRASRRVSSLSPSCSLSRASSTSMRVHVPNTQQCISIPPPVPPRTEKKAFQELSEKFLAVKRRHDQVACMRSRNGDDFLMSDASIATLGAVSLSSGALRLPDKTGLCCGGGNCCVCKDEYFLDDRHGITPSSFADLFVDGDANGQYENGAMGERDSCKIEQQVHDAVESVGNTVKLPSNIDLDALHAKFRQAAAAARAKKGRAAFRTSRRASSLLSSGR